MAEEKTAPEAGGLAKGVLAVLAEAQGQTKKLLAAKLVLLGGVMLTAIIGGLAAWLKGLTDLERGMLWGSAITLLLLVALVLTSGLWGYLRRRKDGEESIVETVKKLPRKKAPTREEIRAHARLVAQRMAYAERLSRETSEDLGAFNEECKRLGVDFQSYPEELQRAIAIDVLLGPHEPGKPR